MTESSSPKRSGRTGGGVFFELLGPVDRPVCLATTGWGTGTGHKVAAIPKAITDMFRVLVYDHPGLGGSVSASHIPSDTEGMASTAVDLLDELNIDRCIVLGRGGLGGCIAHHLAIQSPDRVIATIAIQSWSHADSFFENQVLALMALRQVSFEDYQRSAASLCYTPEYFNRHQTEILGPNGPWTDIRDYPNAHRGLMEASIGHDTRDNLSRIRSPILIVSTGERDWITGGRMGRDLERRLPRADLLWLEQAPHAIHTESNEWERLERGIGSWVAERINGQ